MARDIIIQFEKANNLKITRVLTVLIDFVELNLKTASTVVHKSTIGEHEFRPKYLLNSTFRLTSGLTFCSDLYN